VENRMSREASVAEKLRVYGAAHRTLPLVFERVLADQDGDVYLSHFVRDYASETLQGDGFDAGALFKAGFAPKVLLWLNEVASPQEREAFDDFLADLRRLSSSRTPERGALTSFVMTAQRRLRARRRVVPVEEQLRQAARAKPVQGGGAEGRRPMRLSRLLQKTYKTLKKKKTALLQQNQVAQLLWELLDEANCEGVVLVPMKPMLNGTPLPKVALASPIYGDDAKRDVQLLEKAVGMDMMEEDASPTGLCKTTRAIVNITNIIADDRFPGYNFRTLRSEAISRLSQLTIPVFDDGGHAAGDAGDASEGGTLVGVIRLMNKASFDGSKSGVAFDRYDEVVAGVYATLIVESMNKDWGASSDGSTFSSRLQAAMHLQRIRKELTKQNEGRARASSIGAIGLPSGSRDTTPIIPRKLPPPAQRTTPPRTPTRAVTAIDLKAEDIDVEAGTAAHVDVLKVLESDEPIVMAVEKEA